MLCFWKAESVLWEVQILRCNEHCLQNTIKTMWFPIASTLPSPLLPSLGPAPRQHTPLIPTLRIEMNQLCISITFLCGPFLLTDNDLKKTFPYQSHAGLGLT